MNGRYIYEIQCMTLTLIKTCVVGSSKHRQENNYKLYIPKMSFSGPMNVIFFGAKFII